MTAPTPYLERAQHSAEFLKTWRKNEPPPEVVVVLGSGLGDAIPGIDSMEGLPYGAIPGFPTPHVVGHKGELRVGAFGGKCVAFLRGRSHFYEGHTPGDVVHALRSLLLLGAKGVVLTNAAGCMEATWKMGSLMLITDHINHTGTSPLIGEWGRGFAGPQFPDMTLCYTPSWQNSIRKAAAGVDVPFYEGIYIGVTGPCYETPAEIRAYKSLGASAVGMSTVMEAIAARHMGAKVAGISAMTNYGSGLKGNEILDHKDILVQGKELAGKFARVLESAIATLD